MIKVSALESIFVSATEKGKGKGLNTARKSFSFTVVLPDKSMGAELQLNNPIAKKQVITT
jgi:hypothetical protein